MSGLLLPYIEQRSSGGVNGLCPKSKKYLLNGTTCERVNYHQNTETKERIDLRNGGSSKKTETNGIICDDTIYDLGTFTAKTKSYLCQYVQEWKPLCNHRTCEPPPLKHDDGSELVTNREKELSKGRIEFFQCPVEKQFSIIQLFLRDMNLPATIDRSLQPRRSTRNDIAIVYLAELMDGMAPFMEGNHQYPGSTLLVLTASWVSRIPSDQDSSQDWLYVHKAITLDAGGQTFVDCFVPPRRATYIVNLLIGPVTLYYPRHEGEIITSFGLDCPVSSTQSLSKRADNKLLTRTMCAAVGVFHPITLGFWLPCQSADIIWEHHESITVIRLPGKDAPVDWFLPHVSHFLASKSMRDFAKIVVKPFGSQWNTCRGVSFHSITDMTGILSAILDLMTEIEDGDGVLVESFHDTFEPHVPGSIGHHAINVEGMNLGFRVRSIVSRTPQNGARMTMIVCGVADKEKPISGVVSFPASLELTLHQWGMCDKKQVQEIHDSIRRNSEDLMLEFMRRERQLLPVEKGCASAQTDLLGIDFILTTLNEVVTPVVIEVNSHDCLCACFMYENTNQELQGQTTFVVVQTMLANSQKYLMRDKVVVVIGAGGYNMRHLWSECKTFGVKIVLIDSNPDHFARSEVHKFIQFDMTDHRKDKEHADHLVKVIRMKVGHLDGCLTLEENCGPLVALVADRLSLGHTSKHAAIMNARQKGLAMKTLYQCNNNQPLFKHPSFFTSPIIHVNGPDNLESALKQVPLPAVMKLEFSSDGFGTKQIYSHEEALQHLTFIQKTLVKESYLCGTGFDYQIILMQLLLGTEHNVQIVLFEGEVMAAFISDNGPARKPFFTKTASAMPSVLCEEKQHQLTFAAASCCRNLGLLTGVFDVRMIMTPSGPKFIKVSNHMGYSYLREWVHVLYGIDLLHLALMAACGVSPVTSNSIVKGYNSEKVRRDSGQCLGILLYASRHGHALATSATLERLLALHKQGVVFFTQLEPEVREMSSEFEKPFGNLAVFEHTLSEAHTKLVNVCETLGLETKETLREILQDFV